MSLFNETPSKDQIQQFITTANNWEVTTAAGMTEQFLLSQCEFNKLIPVISAQFLTQSIPDNFNDMDCHDVYDFIEEHVEDDFEHMLPETIFECIENIASDIHHKIRSAK
jgi:hypothetical protein